MSYEEERERYGRQYYISVFRPPFQYQTTPTTHTLATTTSVLSLVFRPPFQYQTAPTTHTLATSLRRPASPSLSLPPVYTHRTTATHTALTHTALTHTALIVRTPHTSQRTTALL